MNLLSRSLYMNIKQYIVLNEDCHSPRFGIIHSKMTLPIGFVEVLEVIFGRKISHL